MRIIRKAKKYEEVAEVLSISKHEDRKIVVLSYLRYDKIAKTELKFDDVPKMNEVYNRIISDEFVDITEYCNS